MKTTAGGVWLCLLVLTCISASAQKLGLERIDSLKKDLVTFAKADTNKCKTIFRITDAYTSVNPDSAMKYAKTGMALAKQLNFKNAIAGFYNAFGMLYSDNSDYEQALQNYLLSANINKQIGNKRNLTATLNNIGTTYERQGNFVKSQEYNFKALKMAEELGNTKLISLLTSNIANIYLGQQNYREALSFFVKALKSYQSIGDLEGQGKVNDKIGSYYHLQKQVKEAGIYYEKALKFFKETDDKLGEATVLSHMALLYEDDPDKKLDNLIKAQKLFDETDPKYNLSITNLGNIGGTYADLYLHRKPTPGQRYQHIPADPDQIANKAELYLNKAIAYSREAGDVDNLSTFSDNLAQLQEVSGDYKNALTNYKTSRNINDSIYSQESKNKIAELTAKYNFQKKEDLYKQKQQISELRMRQLYLYAALAILLIIGIMLFLLNRSRIGQLRLKNELQQKQAEEKTRELLHQNKISESELKAIRSQMNPHFIFNVLNSIESYILDNDPKMACRLVQKFATLSRIILENSTQSLVTAEREWKALQLYTELEAIRFSHQFSYSFEADPLIDMSAVRVPPMLIQPLIENSIHHGLRNSPNDEKALHVKLEQTTDELIFTVDDNGVGINENAPPKTYAFKNKSLGLAAIRDRIDIINTMNSNVNKQVAGFEIYVKQPSQGHGTIAKLKLPKVSKIG